LKKKFVTNLALLLILNLLIKTFWMFGIDRKVQNIVGSEEYGLYFSLLSFSILLNILLDLGIINYNNREIARDQDMLNPNISRILPLKFLLAILYAIVVFSIGFLMGYSAKQFQLLSVLIINQFFLSFILFLRSNISGLHLFRTDALISVADRSFVIIICAILIWGNVTQQDFQIEWLVYSQTAGYFLSFLIVLTIVLRKSGKLKLRFGFKNGMSILRKSYPFAILILLMSFFNRFDSVLLERLLEDGKMQAGIYAHSYRILDSVNMFSVLVAGMLLPIFSRMIKQGESPGEMIKLSFSIVFVPAITLSIISWFYSYEIIDLLYNEQIAYSSSVFQILMNGFIFISTSYVFGTLLTANRSLKQLNIFAALTVLLNLVLNLVLIPELKARGAAIASISSQAFYALAQLIAARKILKIRINILFITRLFLFVIILFLTSWLSKNLIPNWGIGFLLSCLAALFYAAFLKIITPKGIYRIIKYDE
jgi:O-antigen/teichoic acid export membrane protein